MFDKFKHLLVPLDFTEKNDAVLETVHEIVASTRARVTLIHIIEPIDDFGDVETKDFTRKLSEEADRQLLQRAERFSDTDITVTCENRTGKRNVEVVTYAGDNDVDLILLNSHTIDPSMRDKTTFSLSYQIALLAPCAVLLLKT